MPKNMPIDQEERFPYRNELEMPVIGLESEFKTFVDDVEVVPGGTVADSGLVHRPAPPAQDLEVFPAPYRGRGVL
ncbi:MAG: hypothetical protein ABI837_11645 [Acidobacteriota bacterium]